MFRTKHKQKQAGQSTVQLSVTQLEDRLTPTVTWHGGPVLPHVQVENLYLGSDWTTAAGTQWAGNLVNYTAYLVKSPYMDALYREGYGVGSGQAYQGKILPYAFNKAGWLYDAAIRQDIEQAIYRGGARQPDANSLYVVYVEPGVKVVSPEGTTSTRDFLGYHSYFVGYDAYGRSAIIPYVVVPFPGSPNISSRGFPSDFAEVTAVTSHEVAEAVTDPCLNAWYDNTGRGEIGDIHNNLFQVLGGYYVQLVSSKNDQAMYVSNGPIYTVGGGIVAWVGAAAPVRAGGSFDLAIGAIASQEPTHHNNQGDLTHSLAVALSAADFWTGSLFAN